MTDRDDIVEALTQVAAAQDSRDWDAVRACFSPDTHSYGVHGQDALIERLQA